MALRWSGSGRGGWRLAAMLLAAAAQGPTAYAASASVETLVFVRHAEKPAASLGQLTCQGLNRALALPPVLIAKYGRPDYIFAPDPRQAADDPHRAPYDYVRPLATIEPTAIQLGLPVNTQFDTRHSDELVTALGSPQYRSALVVIAWEHMLAEHMVKALLKQGGGDPTLVPAWPGNDYDSIYVVEIRRDDDKPVASFHRDREGLDGQSELCPAQQAKPGS